MTSMPLAARARPPARLGLALLLALGACDCGDEPTDEERLREAIDTSSVHLWVAAKVALTKSGDDPKIAEARRRLSGVVGALADMDLGAAGEAASEGEVELSLRDALALGEALFALKDTGAEIVREGSEDELEPLLPTLLRMSDPDDPVAGRIDRSTDHAIFFLGLWVAKVSPKSPVPIPEEVLLYEASRTDVDALAFPSLRAPVLGLRSTTYGRNELCDLAQRDADALEAMDDQAEALRDVFTGVGGERLTLEQAGGVDAGVRALAHGSTAYCYFGRGEDEEARAELRKFVDTAKEAGAEPADLGLLRAYLAFEDEDLEETRAQLELAKGAAWMSEAQQEDVDELLAHLEEEDGGFLEAYFDRAFFARFTARLVLHELDEAGVDEAVEETEAWRAVAGFVQATGGAIGGAAEELEGAARGAAEEASELWRSVREAASGAADLEGADGEGADVEGEAE